MTISHRGNRSGKGEGVARMAPPPPAMPFPQRGRRNFPAELLALGQKYDIIAAKRLLYFYSICCHNGALRLCQLPQSSYYIFIQSAVTTAHCACASCRKATIISPFNSLSQRRAAPVPAAAKRLLYLHSICCHNGALRLCQLPQSGYYIFIQFAVTTACRTCRISAVPILRAAKNGM